MKTITYQGVKGAFSYITARNEFGENNFFVSSQTFKEAFESVANGQADYAVMPIENSLIGSIYENYDLLNVYEMEIVGECFTKIEHCLLTLSASNNLKQLKKVFSHPKALEQCAKFFQKHPWIEAVVHMNTAAAAEEIAAHRNPTCGAIASATAAELYGLHILERGIEDDPRNYTRFVTITKNAAPHSDVDKCSLLLQLKHTSGMLAVVLKLFADRGINLTKIESRPLRGIPFEYVFYVDFEFHGKTRNEVEELLKELSTKVQLLKILGFYRRGTLWTC